MGIHGLLPSQMKGIDIEQHPTAFAPQSLSSILPTVQAPRLEPLQGTVCYFTSVNSDTDPFSQTFESFMTGRSSWPSMQYYAGRNPAFLGEALSHM